MEEAADVVGARLITKLEDAATPGAGFKFGGTHVGRIPRLTTSLAA